MIEVILDIFRDLASLASNVYILLGYILSGVGIVAVLYFLIIRPIVKSFTDRGKRWYWVSHLMLIVWGFVIGPLILINLYDSFEVWGMIIGLVVYATPLFLALRNDKNIKES